MPQKFLSNKCFNLNFDNQMVFFLFIGSFLNFWVSSLVTTFQSKKIIQSNYKLSFICVQSHKASYTWIIQIKCAQNIFIGKNLKVNLKVLFIGITAFFILITKMTLNCIKIVYKSIIERFLRTLDPRSKYFSAFL